LSHYSAGSPAPSQHQYCIAFEQRLNQSQIEQILDRFSAKVIRQLHSLSNPIYVVEIRTLGSPEKKKQEISGTSGVLYVTSEDQELENLKIESIPARRVGNAQIKKPTGKPIKDGSLGLQARYQRVVTEHLPGLYACVSKRTDRRKKQGVYALIEAHIDIHGRVKSVRISKSNIRDPKMLNCFRKKIYTWRDFPRRQTPADLTVRFNIRY